MYSILRKKGEKTGNIKYKKRRSKKTGLKILNVSFPVELVLERNNTNRDKYKS